MYNPYDTVFLTDHRKSQEMFSSTVTAFLIVIYTLEAFVIIVGNTFTIIVFWTQRSRLKRTYSILINLAVSDLLVGIAEPIVLGTAKIAKMTAIPGKEKSFTNPSSAFQVLASSTSVLFLALISLERVYSVLWPVHHRATRTRSYIFVITVVWGLGFCFFGLSVLSLYHTKIERKYVILTIHACLFIALLAICGSYLQIRRKWRSNVIPGEEIHARQTTVKNSFHSYRCVTGVLVASDYCVHCQTILPPTMCWTDCNVACKCSSSGKFYGQSDRLQL